MTTQISKTTQPAILSAELMAALEGVGKLAEQEGVELVSLVNTQNDSCMIKGQATPATLLTGMLPALLSVAINMGIPSEIIKQAAAFCLDNRSLMEDASEGEITWQTSAISE